MMMTASGVAWADEDDDAPDVRPPAGRAANVRDQDALIREYRREFRRDARERDEAEFWLGISCIPLRDSVRDRVNSHDALPAGISDGLLVNRVYPDSPAAKAGIKEADVLISAEKKSLKGTRDLLEVVQAAKGKEFKLELARDGELKTLAVTPGKRPDRPREPSDRDGAKMDRLYQLFDRDGGPLRMQFFHPGMLLPPGAMARTTLPDDMSVKINKQGKKPAEIEVTQGDKSWKVTEDKLSDLPEDVRNHVAGFLGRPFMGKFHVELLGPDEHPRGEFNVPVPPPGTFRSRPRPPEDRSHEPMERDGQIERRLSRRLDEMSERLREMRDELDRLRPRRGDRPAPREREREDEPNVQ